MTLVLSLRPSKKSPKKARCFGLFATRPAFWFVLVWLCFYLYSVLYTLDKSTDVITPMSCRTADATAASARSEVIYLSHAIANVDKFWRYPATTGTSISTWKLRCNKGRKVVTRFIYYSLNDRYHAFSAPATTFLNFYFMAMNNRLLKCIIRKAALNRTKRHITCSDSWKDYKVTNF